MSRHFDLIVIGSGPAGKSAAIQASKLGKTVLMVEKNQQVGGVSVHSGTIPSKTLQLSVRRENLRKGRFVPENFRKRLALLGVRYIGSLRVVQYIHI